MDLLHTHLTFGVVEGCPGCEQHVLDLARARYANAGGPGFEDGLSRLQLWYSVRSYTRRELLSVQVEADTLVPI